MQLCLWLALHNTLAFLSPMCGVHTGHNWRYSNVHCWRSILFLLGVHLGAGSLLVETFISAFQVLAGLSWGLLGLSCEKSVICTSRLMDCLLYLDDLASHQSGDKLI